MQSISEYLKYAILPNSKILLQLICVAPLREVKKYRSENVIYIYMRDI